MAEVNFLKSNKQENLPSPQTAMGQLCHNICVVLPTKTSLPPVGVPAQEPACECGWLVALFYDDNWGPPVSSRRVCLKVHFSYKEWAETYTFG